MKRVLSVLLFCVMAIQLVSAKHQFLCTNNQQYVPFDSLGFIKFVPEVAWEGVWIDENGVEKDTVIYQNSARFFDKNGSKYGLCDITPKSCSYWGSSTVIDIPENLYHPIFVNKEVGAELGINGFVVNKAMDENYCFPSLYNWSDEEIMHAQEGTKLSFKGVCDHCTPILSVSSLVNLTPEYESMPDGTLELTMPPAPFQIYVHHGPKCYYTLANEYILDNIMQEYFVFNYSLDGYHEMGNSILLRKMYGELASQDVVTNWIYNFSKTYDDYKNICLQNNTWLSGILWIANMNLIRDITRNISSLDYAAKLYPSHKKDISIKKAILLVIRADAYLSMLQVYAPRWEESNNGSKLCIPIAAKVSEEDIENSVRREINEPLVSMGAIRDYIYSDIDLAIKLFGEYDFDNSDTPEIPGADAANGIGARLAILVHDWNKAVAYASAGMVGHDIMDGEHYLQGFMIPTSEWIWTVPNNYSKYGAYFMQFGSFYACNGPYPGVWGNGSGGISLDLYRLIPEGDIRKECFITPDKFDSSYGINEDSFFSNIILNEKCSLWGKNSLMGEFLTDFAAKYASHFQIKPQVSFAKNFQTGKIGDIVIPVGQQLKFWSQDTYGTTAFPVMRASELLLIKCEALYEQGKESEARQLLNEFGKKRIENYNCNKSGTQLRDEIRLQRRIELWGEGFSWFDFKRWNLPIKKTPLKLGDKSSGNAPDTDVLDLRPNEINGWTFPIPQNEINKNKALQ